MSYQIITAVADSQPQDQRPDFVEHYAMCGIAGEYRHGEFKANNFHGAIPSCFDIGRLLSSSAVDDCFKHDMLDMFWAQDSEVVLGPHTHAPASITVCFFPADYNLFDDGLAKFSVLRRNENRRLSMASYPLRTSQMNVFFMGISPSFKIDAKGEFKPQIRSTVESIGDMIEENFNSDWLVGYIAGDESKRSNLHVCFSEMAKDMLDDGHTDNRVDACIKNARTAAEIAAMYHKEMQPAFNQLIIL